LILKAAKGLREYPVDESLATSMVKTRCRNQSPGST
jgi:hypothetical protein